MTDKDLVGHRHAEEDPATDPERRCVHDRVVATPVVSEERLS